MTKRQLIRHLTLTLRKEFVNVKQEDVEDFLSMLICIVKEELRTVGKARIFGGKVRFEVIQKGPIKRHEKFAFGKYMSSETAARKIVKVSVDKRWTSAVLSE